tara:strand:+ start:847 stop:1500 length:654 start_codon:yes stop_codon:yes gene_type:complete
MATVENNNEYSVYVIFTNDILDEEKVVDKLLTHMTQENDILFCRSCLSQDKQPVNRYICSLRKSFYDHLQKECNFKRGEDFNITKYRTNNEPLSNGMTYGFFIKCDEEEEKKITSVFQKFETCGFLRPSSYHIQTPNPYPNGDRRGYVIISFEKQGDRYPKQFIRKLKALLNNATLTNRRIHVNWASHSVIRDVTSDASKDRKTGNSRTERVAVPAH